MLPKLERFADAETGTGFTLRREAVRDPVTSFALFTSLRMTVRVVERFADSETGTGFTLRREEDPSSRWSSGRLARRLSEILILCAPRRLLTPRLRSGLRPLRLASAHRLRLVADSLF
jgi:hypothetical protein